MAIFSILVFYVALVAMVYWHEVGHFGKKIQISQWFPLPVGRSVESSSQYGGLAINLVTAIGIMMWKPENIFLQMFGLANGLHFVLYCFWGSFNKEVNWPSRMWKYVTFDDIPNKLWFIFVPLGAWAMWYMSSYYFPILQLLWS